MSRKELHKIRLQILKLLNDNYHKTNDKSISLDIIKSVIVPLHCYIDENDIKKAITSLLADLYVEEYQTDIFITQKGMEYLNNHTNRFVKYLISNHLAIIALVISIIALFCK